MVSTIEEIKNCPACGSDNLVHITSRDQVICKACGMVHEPFSSVAEEVLEITHPAEEVIPTERIKAVLPTAKPKKVKKKAKKKKPKKKAKKKKKVKKKVKKKKVKKKVKKKLKKKVVKKKPKKKAKPKPKPKPKKRSLFKRFVRRKRR